MTHSTTDRKIILISTTCAVVVFDQVSKWLAADIFQLPIRLNRGIAWSIPIPNALMTFLVPILLVAIVYYLQKKAAGSIFAVASGGLILGGGLGNLIDRIRIGAVIDFIAIPYFPTFNLADTAITIGAFVLIIFYGKIFP
ncbi:MAG: signal peptidase II [Patescibacteria group bacterium]